MVNTQSAEEMLKNNVSKESCLGKIPNISYFSLYRFASAWDKLLIAVGLTATFVAGLTLPYAITLVANIFQSMIDYTKSIGNTSQDDKEEILKTMHHFGMYYSLIGLVIFIGGYLGTTLMNIAAIHQIFKLREAYLRAALNQDFAYFDVHQTGDFASRMAEDVIKLEEGIGDKVSTFVYNLSTGISCVTMALMKGWKLALLCLTTAPLTLLLVGLTGMLANKLYKRQSHANGLASAVAEEAISAIKTVYAFNGQEKELQRYQKHINKAIRINIKREFYTGMSMGCLYFCIFGSYALSFYFGIYLVVNEPEYYNADVMFSVFFGIMTALGSFGVAGSLMTSFGLACGAGAHIFSLLDNVPTINPLLNKGFQPLKVEGDLELKKVVFNYPSRPNVPILRGVCLSVQRGQSVALVGPSGSGKSTIIHLLCRFYDVVEGSVSIDGADVRELSVRWVRAQIGLVGQEPVLFNCSVRDNIRYGREDAADDEVEAAAKKANAHHFIMKLPAGYNTVVGQRGESLSGGQKQRIAIARALIREPRILLLDEATSALDTASEAKVQAALYEASKDRTTVIVAHRLSTIKNVDVIHVIKEGQIVESGNHEELIKRKGYYYDMLTLQESPGLGESDECNVPFQDDSRLFEYEGTMDTCIQEKSKDESKVKTLSFRRVMALNAPECKYIAIGSIAATINGFSMPLFIVIFGNLIGSLSNPDATQLMMKVQLISVACICIGIALGVCNVIEASAFGVAGSRLTRRLRLRMFAHMLRQHAGYFDERAHSPGALCARLSGEAALVHGATGQRIGIVLQSVGSVGLALILGVWFEWRVGLVILAFVPFIAFVVYKQGKATEKESTGYSQAIENSSKLAVEAVSNVRTAGALGLQARLVRGVRARLEPALRPAARAARCRGLLAALSRSMFYFINAAALTYGGHLIVADAVAPDHILVTTQALQMASMQAQNAFNFAPDFQKGVSAASRIVHFLETKPRISDPDEPAIKHFIPKGEASFEKVDFKYPTRPGINVFRGLTLEIPQGQTIAVVGQSGCGKSTLIQLLQRYYDPDAGVVALDDIQLPQLRLNEARGCFGLVSQEPVLFNRSIRENIAYGDNSRVPSYEEIYDVAKQANIHNFIISLPEGYDTNIGSKGIQLSGGQKQRVAIARALLRCPKILLLDEATSALDTENEKAVQEALETAKAGRTCVVIAHRLSTVRDADLICVLSGGRVAESGTHAHLMRLQGLYYNLHATL